MKPSFPSPSVTSKNAYGFWEDTEEHDRLDLQHAVYLQIFGALSLAPLQDQPLDRVLDIATGTASWAIDFAKDHPTSRITATDIIPIDDPGLPENVTCIIEDAEGEWSNDEPYNYIHGRDLITCFTSVSSVIKKVYANLAPGGLLELQDVIVPFEFTTPPPASAVFPKWMEDIIAASKVIGRPFDHVKHYKQYMIEAGFEIVVDVKRKTPIGVWGEDIWAENEMKVGQWTLLNVSNAVELWTAPALTVTGFSNEECEKLVEQVKDELRDGRLQPFAWTVCIVGRKALSS